MDIKDALKHPLMIAYLESMKNGEVELLPDAGICDHVYEYMMDVMPTPCHGAYAKLLCVLAEYFKKWPDYSGNWQYPITVKGDPYSEYMHCTNMWNTETKFGKKRMKLLDFLIVELKKEIS